MRDRETNIPATIRERQFTVKDGTLSVLEAGKENEQRIVLLHGIPANAYLFRDVIPILAEAGYHVLAPHMPGYGNTRLSDSADYSLSAVADLYATWLETENLNPVWLVGHDLGGAVAQMIAVRYPHLLTHLTIGNAPIGDSFPVFAVNTAIFAARAGILPLLVSLKLIPNPYMSHEVRRGFADASRMTQDMWDTIFWANKVQSKEGIKEFTKHLKHLRNDEAVAIVPQLSEIPVPALVLWSDTDLHQAEETIGQKLHAALPEETDYRVVKDAGHFMPIETPEAYANALLNWRQSLAD